MSVYKTEITSDQIISDNPIHQRLLKPYELIGGQVSGDVLELGCGEGRGVEQILSGAATYLGLDKIDAVIKSLRLKYTQAEFITSDFPPVRISGEARFDHIISFQVIEHIGDDRLFLQEIYRLLKPGGSAILTTPNIKKTLTRNPWHVREYTASELKHLAEDIFDEVRMKGITGNEKVMRYYDENKRSVDRILKFDVLDLQHRLPAFILKLPYELLNRMNRNRLKKGDNQLVETIHHTDYLVTDQPDEALDLLIYLYKK